MIHTCYFYRLYIESRISCLASASRVKNSHKALFPREKVINPATVFPYPLLSYNLQSFHWRQVSRYLQMHHTFWELSRIILQGEKEAAAFRKVLLPSESRKLPFKDTQDKWFLGITNWEWYQIISFIARLCGFSFESCFS